MDLLRFFNLTGNTGTYQETTAYIPGVVLGAALPGMQSIGRPDVPTSKNITTGLRVEKDADNYQLWMAVFNDDNTEDLEWFAPETPSLSVGTLTYGDTVSVTAVPLAEMLSQMVDLIETDAAYLTVVTSDSTFTLTAAHHNKTVMFNAACTVTIDNSGGLRTFCCHVVQGGTGQITLAASAGHQYNEAGYNTAHVIANSRYKQTSIYSGLAHGYLVTA